MIKVVFEYKDEFTHGEWRRQECAVENVAQCVKFYGLDKCEHRIVSVEEAKK